MKHVHDRKSTVMVQVDLQLETAFLHFAVLWFYSLMAMTANFTRVSSLRARLFLSPSETNVDYNKSTVPPRKWRRVRMSDASGAH